MTCEILGWVSTEATPRRGRCFYVRKESYFEQKYLQNVSLLGCLFGAG